MNGLLLPAIVFQGLSVLLLLAVFIVAVRSERSRFSWYWITGWSAYAVRFVFELADALRPGTFTLPTLMLAAASVSAIFLLAAALSLRTGRSYSKAGIAASIAIALATTASTPLGATIPEITFAIFLLLGVVQIYTGLVFIGIRRRGGSLGALLAGIALIVWGLHKWDYPFLRPMPSLAPTGYLLSSFLMTMVGIAVTIMLYEDARAASRREAERYRGLFESLTDCVYVSEFAGEWAGRFVEVNDVALQTLGWSREEFLGMTVNELDGGDTRPAERTERMKALAEGGRVIFRQEHRAKSGGVIPFEVCARRFELDGRPAVLGIARNIAEREANEERLKRTIADKEILLREVHHRVKNNLQIVSSLLTLQEGAMRDPADAASVAGLQARITSMALVHEMLYRDADMRAIDMESYFRDLVDGIVASWAGAARISVELEAGGVSYSIDRAIPVGLIVSELAMNACKHAFRGRYGGSIRLSLRRSECCDTLEFADDGVGLPQNACTDTLGLELVRVLVSQMRGRLECRPGPGTAWHMELPADPLPA